MDLQVYSLFVSKSREQGAEKTGNREEGSSLHMIEREIGRAAVAFLFPHSLVPCLKKADAGGDDLKGVIAGQHRNVVTG